MKEVKELAFANNVAYAIVDLIGPPKQSLRGIPLSGIFVYDEVGGVSRKTLGKCMARLESKQ